MVDKRSHRTFALKEENKERSSSQKSVKSAAQQKKDDIIRESLMACMPKKLANLDGKNEFQLP